MKSYQYHIIILFLLSISSTTWSATHWVGDSAACNGSNVHESLNLALFAAALNGDPIDEIRLTNTVDYTGLTNGRYTLTDWSSSGAGVLTLVGGYTDCFGSVSGRTLVGDSSDVVFAVGASANETSNVTFRNIQMSLTSATRALTLGSGTFVTLDNVLISSNQSGVEVTGGGYLEVLDNSLIQFNGNTNNTLGGGIYCTGNNSTVILGGRMHRNQGLNGGNLHIRSGCYLEITDGARIEGRGTVNGLDAVAGAGLFVDNGGQVLAAGEANRVIFDGNKAEVGGAIYINGTGLVILENTHINGSEAPSGAAIFAIDGGTATPQLIMDQTSDCNLLFRCSEIQGARHEGTVIEVNNSFVQIQRTVIERSDYMGQEFVFSFGLVTAINSKVRLNRVGMIRNEGWSMFRGANANLEISHFTMADNNRPNVTDNSYVYVPLGGLDNIFNMQNSLIADSSGIDLTSGAIYDGGCNLIDDDTFWPIGLYDIGVPDFQNVAAGDARQLAGSLGVDMCQQDSFSWSTEIDIENQNAPVNENTNQQGMPGQAGGLYDAGFDEVYDNIGEDEFLLTIEKEGSGEGVVISNPAGISCGSDCTEVIFNGTIVTLFASPITGSEFIRWRNCPLVNQAGECLTSMESSQTIRAVFDPDDLIFRDGFE